MVTFHWKTEMSYVRMWRISVINVAMITPHKNVKNVKQKANLNYVAQIVWATYS